MSARPPVSDLKTPQRWIDGHHADAAVIVPPAGLAREHFALAAGDAESIEAALSCVMREDLDQAAAGRLIDLALRCAGRVPQADNRVVSALTYIVREIGDEPLEHFLAVWFDAARRVRYVSRYECNNTAGEAWVSLRALLRDAALLDVAACVAAHNHPDGCLMASQADQAFHAAFSRALSALGVPLLCNAVVTSAGAVDIGGWRRWSFRRSGIQSAPEPTRSAPHLPVGHADSAHH